MSEKKIPVFDPNAYHQWRFTMTTYLESEERWGAIVGEADEAWEEMNDAEKRKTKKKAFYDLIRSLGPKHQQYALNFRCDQPEGLWKRLETIYGGEGTFYLCSLSEKWVNLRWKEEDNVATFFAAVTKLTTELAAAGKPVSDRDLFTTVVSKIPPRYGQQRAIMQTWDKPDMCKVEQLLRNEEERQKLEIPQKESREGTNFSMTGRRRKVKVLPRPHVETKGREKKNKNFECFFCKKEGHLKRDCRKWQVWKAHKEEESKKGEKKKEKYSEGRLQRLEEKERNHENDGFSFILGTMDNDSFIEEEEEINENSDYVDSSIDTFLKLKRGDDELSDKWILDSGASHHITRNRNSFRKLTKHSAKIFTGEKGKFIMVEGIGEITFHSQENEMGSFIIKDVYFCPEAAGNVISTSQLACDGYRTLFELDKAQILEKK